VTDPASPSVNNSPGDVLNVVGRLFRNDRFTVTDNNSISTAMVTTLRRGVPNPVDNRLLEAVFGREIDVNGNLISTGGIETLRLIRLGGGDTTDIEAGLNVQVI